MALAAQRAQADGKDARTRLLAIIRKKSLLRGIFKAQDPVEGCQGEPLGVSG